MIWGAVLLLLQVDQKAIDKAIDKGALALKTKFQQPRGIAPTDYELVVWTLLHAGATERDPIVAQMLQSIITRPSWQTYNAALRAMILQKVDPKRFRPQLIEIAQFFADTQCENGQWGYGNFAPPQPKPPQPEVLPSPWKTKKKGETEAIPTTKIKKKGAPAAKRGDNSNSQYAALGIRACADAQIELPEDSLKLAKEWWERSQQGDGGWTYADTMGIGFGKGSYGSMTCGAIGVLAIIKTLLKESDVAKDPRLQRGFNWLAQNFSVKENPKTTPLEANKTPFYFYYLYSLERAGDLTGTDKFGDHDWYPAGASELVKTQRPDGLWPASGNEGDVWATCFAVLFLKRATKPLPTIKTEGSK
jgi:hypothetical protein